MPHSIAAATMAQVFLSSAWSEGVASTLFAAAPQAATRASASGVPVWIWIMLIIAGTIATATDLRSMRIPNWLTLPLLAAGVGYGFAIGGVSGLTAALAGAAAAGAMFVLAYAVLGGGAGDAKLMLAFGSWIGLDASIVLVVAVTLVGFFYAVGVVIARGGIRDVPALILLGIVRTAGGMVLLRRRVLVGSKPEDAADASSATAPTDGSGGPETHEKPPSKRPPSGWLPYAPAILGGVICTWIYLEVVR